MAATAASSSVSKMRSSPSGSGRAKARKAPERKSAKSKTARSEGGRLYRISMNNSLEMGWGCGSPASMWQLRGGMQTRRRASECHRLVSPRADGIDRSKKPPSSGTAMPAALSIGSASPSRSPSQNSPHGAAADTLMRLGGSSANTSTGSSSPRSSAETKRSSEIRRADAIVVCAAASISLRGSCLRNLRICPR